MKTFIAATLFAIAYAEEAAADAAAETPAATEEITYPKVYAKTAWSGAAAVAGTSEQVLSGEWWTVQSEENKYSLHWTGTLRVFAFGIATNHNTAEVWVDLQEQPNPELDEAIQRAFAFYDSFSVSQTVPVIPESDKEKTFIFKTNYTENNRKERDDGTANAAEKEVAGSWVLVNSKLHDKVTN